MPARADGALSAAAPQSRSRPESRASRTCEAPSLRRVELFQTIWSWIRAFSEEREPQRLPTLVVSPRHAACERAHAQNIALALRHRDRAPRIQQVERMRSFQHLLIGGQRQPALQQLLAGSLVVIEVPEQGCDLGALEVVAGLLDLVLMEHVTVGHAPQRAVGPHDVVNALDTLQIHREPLETVSDLARHRPAVEAA